MKELSEICFTAEEVDSEFVGISYEGANTKIIFPLGYRIPKDDEQLHQSVKNLLSLIRLITQKKSYYTDIGEYEAGAEGLPIDSYFWVIEDYFTNGIYIDNEKEYTINFNGKINWKRTFKTKFFVNKGGLVFLNPVVEKKKNIKNIISEIHTHCLDQSSEKLWFFYSQMPKLSNIKTPNLRNYLNIINQELLIAFDDRKKTLLYHMKRIILSEINNEGQHKVRNYGVNKFEYVWEFLIDEVYGTEDVKKYYPTSEYNIKNSGTFQASKLRPDTMMRDESDNFYVIDAKYYKAGIITKDNKALKQKLPSTDSIQKQITYGDFVHHNFSVKEEIENVYNAFVLPYNKDKNELLLDSYIENIGTATANWTDFEKSDQKHLSIAIILIDTKHLLDLFFNKKINHEDLSKKIKEVLDNK